MIEDPLLACAGTSEEARRDSGIAQPLTPPDEDSSKQLSLSPQVPSSPGSAPDEGEQCELEVEPSENVSATDEPNMVIHAKVYAIADKYDIPGLKDLAKGKFEAQVSKHWDCVEFSDALEEVYCSTVDGNRGLRDIVLQAFRENPRLVMKPEVESAVRDLAPLAFDLYKIASGLPV
ncbi:MAG: hypothetical protein M1820_002058 [Bogoriella megaspora]|nr:MAG: hypothetical protein M1820_002058 [Bogoriella megaspora]